ncbi:hypothetical protein [Nostoc sp.]
MKQLQEKDLEYLDWDESFD